MTHSDPITVWDLPTRLFHWTLVVLIALQYLGGEFDLLPMEWHFRFGYATLVLLLFRILWGFFGSSTSRFGAFLRGPGAVVRYARDGFRAGADARVGHNPLGGWSVLLMIASVVLQAVSGLFSSDDLTETGPLAARVSDATVAWMTRVHHINRYVLLILIVLHIVAITLYWTFRRENLVAPMVHGRRDVVASANVRIVSTWRAFALLLLSAIAVGLVVAWGNAA
jgi:cytochrome b